MRLCLRSCARDNSEIFEIARPIRALNWGVFQKNAFVAVLKPFDLTFTNKIQNAGMLD